MSAATLEKPLPVSASTTGHGRVLIATVNRSNGDTGVHTHTRSLTSGLVQAGRDVRVVTPFDSGKRWLPVFAVRPLVLRRLNPTWGTQWYRHWHMAALRQSLRAVMSDARVCHVLAQCPLSARTALDVRAEIRAEDRIAVTAICHFNRSEADEYRDKGELAHQAAYEQVLAFEAETLGAVDHVAYVSDWAKKLVEDERGIRTQASSVIWNGIADAATTPPTIDRQSLSIAATDVVLLNVGSLEPRKNQVGLVELFAKLHKHHTSARLILVGDGPDRDNIEAAVSRLGIGDRVHLLGHRTDVAELMRVGDIYVHHAKAENCPLVLIEAARAGLPVAAMPVGGVPELLAAIGDAIALDANETLLSIARLGPWLSSAERRDAAGRRSLEAFHRHFGRDAMVRGYLAIIDAHESKAINQ